MSGGKIDAWSKQLPDGRTVEFLFFTLFQAEGKTTSWDGEHLNSDFHCPLIGTPQ
jgi:hypothetical protein